jgi:hypothetical protein
MFVKHPMPSQFTVQTKHSGVTVKGDMRQLPQGGWGNHAVGGALSQRKIFYLATEFKNGTIGFKQNELQHDFCFLYFDLQNQQPVHTVFTELVRPTAKSINHDIVIGWHRTV